MHFLRVLNRNVHDPAPVDERGGLPRSPTSQNQRHNGPPQLSPERLPRERFSPPTHCSSSRFLGRLTGAPSKADIARCGSMPFRVERNNHTSSLLRPLFPPPFPPAERGRVALCRQGCRPEKSWPTTLWRASRVRQSRQGQALRVPCGQPASLDPTV